jgi:hypothetical protein
MFMKPKKTVWQQYSHEAGKRDTALANLFIGTQLSTQLVTYTEFQEFCAVLDPKYTVPGIKYFFTPASTCCYCHAALNFRIVKSTVNEWVCSTDDCEAAVLCVNNKVLPIYLYCVPVLYINI